MCGSCYKEVEEIGKMQSVRYSRMIRFLELNSPFSILEKEWSLISKGNENLLEADLEYRKRFKEAGTHSQE